MSDGCAVAPCVELGWGIHRLYWAESPCLIAVYYAVVLPDLLFGEGIDITFLLCASRRTVCFSYPWPSQQFQQRIERLVPCLFADQLHHFLCHFFSIHFFRLYLDRQLLAEKFLQFVEGTVPASGVAVA